MSAFYSTTMLNNNGSQKCPRQSGNENISGWLALVQRDSLRLDRRRDTGKDRPMQCRAGGHLVKTLMTDTIRGAPRVPHVLILTSFSESGHNQAPFQEPLCSFLGFLVQIKKLKGKGQNLGRPNFPKGRRRDSRNLGTTLYPSPVNLTALRP